MKITIQVTEHDIRRGIPQSHNRCPVARALHRRTGRPWTTDGRDCWPFNEIGPYFRLPEEAELFIACFDSKYPVRPFSFEIDLPPQLTRTRFKTPSPLELPCHLRF